MQPCPDLPDSLASTPASAHFAGDLVIMHVNIQGLISSCAELVARIRLMDTKPGLISVNETFLNRSVDTVEIEGYQLIARRDRCDGRSCGGVAVFAETSIVSQVAPLLVSATSERLWLLIHTNQGPFAVCTWYRPPERGEVDSIHTLQEEWEEVKAQCLAAVIIGDMNVHLRRWLRFSNGDSPEGIALERFCLANSFRQLVHEPTRENYLLDLVLSSSDSVRCRVLPKIADHSVVLATLKLSVPKTATHRRKVWLYDKADWERMSAMFTCTDWTFIDNESSELGATLLTETVLDIAQTCIPQREIGERKSTHPWLTEELVRLVDQKNAAAGGPGAQAAAEACSARILESYRAYVGQTKQEMMTLRRGSKAWWRKSRELLQKKTRACGTPALKKPTGEWVRDADSKACLFASTFASKYALISGEVNGYSCLPLAARAQGSFEVPTVAQAVEELEKLSADSATGPDLLPAKLLKRFASELGPPVQKLTARVLRDGVWPSLWLIHWIVPLYKKKSAFDARNYRGIHLTAQLSKVVERLLKRLFVPFLLASVSFGQNQFAYTPERGARDALLYLVLCWIRAFNSRRRVAVYCSDVSGAFDRVRAERMIEKLKAKGIHPQIVAVLASWLRARTAHVVLEGAKADALTLEDMIYQGTVLGPILWNVFFADAKAAIEDCEFEECVYADDLNAWSELAPNVTDEVALSRCERCQEELHKWGLANQVEFDSGKESMHILSRTAGVGPNFRLLGIDFDVALRMADAVQELVTESGWKMKTMIRTQRFFNIAEMVLLYKSHVLSFIEYRTPAVYHAVKTLLQRVDRIQERFLEDAGISMVEALFAFNLAPLQTRRDMALLGAIHRSALGKGPPHLVKHFPKAPPPVYMTRANQRRHHLYLDDPRDGRHTELLIRSAFGLVAVYNKLPVSVVLAQSVATFQGHLQDLIKGRAEAGCADWMETFSPRRPMLTDHPLDAMTNWVPRGE